MGREGRPENPRFGFAEAGRASDSNDGVVVVTVWKWYAGSGDGGFSITRLAVTMSRF